jgi:hypothetical protein
MNDKWLWLSGGHAKGDKRHTIYTICVFFFHRHLWHFQAIEMAWLRMVSTFPLDYHQRPIV